MAPAGSPFSVNWLILRITRQWVERALRQHAGGRLLDVGCGAQPYRALQQAHCRTWVGLETDRGRYHHCPPTVYGNALELPFRDGSFDTVFTSQVLEHVPEPGQMRAEMARVLRPGGSLIVTAPHIWGVHEAPADYFRFTAYGLQYLARRAGVEPQWTRAMAGYWVTAGARFCYYLQRLERYRMKLLLRPVYCIVQLLAWGLDTVHRVETDAWNHILVARKAADGTAHTGDPACRPVSP